MSTLSNPLLAFPELPRFDAVQPEHVAPAIDTLLAAARDVQRRVGEDRSPPTWANVVLPLADALDRLDRAWSAVGHMNAVVSTDALRDAYHANLDKVTTYFSDLGQDVALYRRYQALRASPAFATLTPAEQRVIDNEIRDFRLGGAELDDAGKARFKAIQQELATLSADFEDHVLDATNAWALYVDEAELEGVPRDVVARAAAEAQAEGREGCKLTLRYPSYRPLIKYAARRELRARMHRGFFTRASALGNDAAYDNTTLVERILALRDEEARLLGYADFAAVSVVPKMAESPAEVLAFLRDLAKRARPFAEREMAELRTYARDALGLDTLEPWDQNYASQKLKESRYAYADETVKQYFTEPRVVAGLFRVVETLYAVSIREATAAVWHPDVRFYEIVDRDGALVGQFFMDLYARAGKQSGAWMDDPINRRVLDAGVQHPVAYLTCNFSAPVAGKPALFTHEEVITLFHEFGHGLHLLLTRVETPGVSGLQGVEWDAVELPSQFMENYCWEWDVVRGMSAHVETGAPLPRELFDKMLAARRFQSGIETMRQLEYGLNDMLLHTEYDATGARRYRSVDDVTREVQREVRVTPLAPYDRTLESFTHIFSGGYAAGYYSYQWALVLAADAYSLFEETGVLSPTTGSRFRDEVLSRGGSRPAMESFVAFRGRPPQLDALLRHNGMTMSS